MSKYATFYDPTAESEKPVPLPSAAPISLSSNVTLQPPLSRRGDGPALILILPADPVNPPLPEGWKKPIDPEPLLKWSEEGYCVLGFTVGGEWGLDKVLEDGLKAVQALKEFTEKKVGVVAYEETLLPQLLTLLPSYPIIKALISFFPLPSPSPIPTLLHLPSNTTTTTVPPKEKDTKTYTYDAKSSLFPLPTFPKEYDVKDASVCHSRSVAFLKQANTVAGPIFDLEALWDEHTWFEFGDRSVAKTMGTMVAEPYVNHVPTLAGGIGRQALSEFYRDHFIFSNPADIENELISRIVGVDRIVDEFIMHFTHTSMVDWLIPGVPPTGKKLQVPMMAVVCVRGDRLYHEHITWDQATVLKQLAMLPDFVPHGQGTQVRLPVAGVETAVKLRDKDAWVSNELLGETFGVHPVIPK
ncbi:hypothetical protein T439DRAFT_345952 [Meredithblackwellia eburnea MCA 4105]